MAEGINATTTGGDGWPERMALDLHDGPLQDVAFAVGHLKALRDDIAAGVPRAALLGSVEELEAVLAGVERALRALCDSAARPGASETRLRESLASIVGAFERRFGVPVASVIEGDVDGLPPEQRHALVQVAREALTNAGRHSGASTVSVTLRTDERGVLLEVRDDGAGVGEAGAEGLGLPGMRSRIERCGGSLAVELGAGGGTVVTARVPPAR